MNEARKVKIVVIGGGNGAAKVINAYKLSAGAAEFSVVSAMSDSGGSTGALRKTFHMPPPGDIMRAVLALSKHDHAILREVFYKTRIQDLPKFNAATQGERGPNLGNLFLAFVSQYEGDFMKAVRALEQVLGAFGHAYPATLEEHDLAVELTSKEVVVGEANIDRPTYNRSLKITRAWLTPEVRAYEPTCEILSQADYIVLSPGSLYCSIIAALLPAGIKDAIAASKARISYIAGNAVEEIGETGPTKLSEIIATLESYLPRPIDKIFYNNHILTLAQQKYYQEKGWKLIDADTENVPSEKLYLGDFEKEGGGLSEEKLYGLFKAYAAKYYDSATGKTFTKPRI